ncbi:hypothetical protein L1987_66198 [Smallanthus sonchifolius]|uniref:Uncharacterized protein n=1 Tax=Smallanthus sonchifolius TaxID=185202 RepID=A0ACB9BWL9_9ASTR|nr:hypothetical protein L1987_66198 [Smallanthus sonchifolius]
MEAYPNQAHQDWNLNKIAQEAGFELNGEEVYDLEEEISRLAGKKKESKKKVHKFWVKNDVKSMNAIYSSSHKILVLGDNNLRYSQLLAEKLQTGNNITIANLVRIHEMKEFAKSGGGYPLQRLKELKAKVIFNDVKSLIIDIDGLFTKIIYIHRDLSNIQEEEIH